jgi:predicted MPP superfamily phosphohydrolase
VRLPWIGTPVLPADQRYAAGYLIEQGKSLFVSTGIGTSILPVRFGVPPEISRLTLRAATRPASTGSGRAASEAGAKPR